MNLHRTLPLIAVGVLGAACPTSVYVSACVHGEDLALNSRTCALLLRLSTSAPGRSLM